MNIIRARANPLVIGAALFVLLFSLLGIAAITGLLPSAAPKVIEPRALAQRTEPAKPAAPAPSRHVPVICPACGVIEAVNAVEVPGEASGVGAVAGGVAGAVVGNTFGHGTGRTVMTIAGAAGGAYAGNVVEKHVKKRIAYRVSVRLDDGSMRTLSQPVPPPFAVGDRVRVVNGTTLERA